MMAAELAEALTNESDAVRAEAAVFVDEAVCTRYLCARNHDCKAAVDMLLATTRWRVKTRPLEVHCPKCQQDALSHSMRWVGFDTANRPVAYTVFSHAQTVVLCGSCNMVLCQPTGGKARLTEGCSFRKKAD